MQDRVDAVAATMARFKGRPFRWGSVDCAKLGAFHLRRMGHHQGLGLAKAGTYRSALGARRAIERAGHASIAAALDGIGLPRIPPAAALPGDVMLSDGTEGLEALAIYAGNGAALGFHEDAAGAEVIRIADWSDMKAWRL
jgi:hypothetical protein